MARRELTANEYVKFTEDGQSVCGVFVGTETDQGTDRATGDKYDRSKHIFQDISTGALYEIAGSRVLDGKMKKAKPGELLCVTYLGKRTSESTGRDYNDYKAEVIEGEDADAVKVVAAEVAPPAAKSGVDDLPF
jgi:hypothetical protein